jgi:diguanylate cyclase (GGDEF)-like protein
VAPSADASFSADELQHPFVADGSSHYLNAIARMPLRLEGEVLGVMNVGYNTQPHQFDDQEIRLLSALADSAALAVHNAALHERISMLAVTDDLTGLANRRRFLQTLRAELQRARRYERPLTLLIVDVDSLKQANDLHGHAAGDAILCSVSQILSTSIRDTDLAARLGGDEFAVLLPETTREAALLIGERIRSAIESIRVTVGSETLCGTVSIGMVSGEAKDLPDLPTFIRIADDALYKSKAMGRNALTALEMPAPDQSLNPPEKPRDASIP